MTDEPGQNRPPLRRIGRPSRPIIAFAALRSDASEATQRSDQRRGRETLDSPPHATFGGSVEHFECMLWSQKIELRPTVVELFVRNKSQRLLLLLTHNCTVCPTAWIFTWGAVVAIGLCARSRGSQRSPVSSVVYFCRTKQGNLLQKLKNIIKNSKTHSKTHTKP